MSVLVGIPTHRRPELLRQCLESIAVQEGELPPIRVFVADNDAKGREGVSLVEEIAATYRFPISATSVAEPGISAVRNAILDEARRGGDEFIAMIDDDVRARPDWLASLLKELRSVGADIISGPVFYDFPPGTPTSLSRAFWTDPRPSGPTDLINGTTAILIDRRALDRAGWPEFDQAFGITGGGDKEWFLRMKSLGATFAWSTEARCNETVPADRATPSWFLRRRMRIGIDDVRLAQRHGSRAERRRLIRDAVASLALAPLKARALADPNRRFKTLGQWATGDRPDPRVVRLSIL